MRDREKANETLVFKGKNEMSTLAFKLTYFPYEDNNKSVLFPLLQIEEEKQTNTTYNKYFEYYAREVFHHLFHTGNLLLLSFCVCFFVCSPLNPHSLLLLLLLLLLLFVAVMKMYYIFISEHHNNLFLFRLDRYRIVCICGPCIVYCL